MRDIREYVLGDILEKEGIWYGVRGNYWSNIDKNKNKEYVKDLKDLDAYGVMEKYFPEHEEVIFSPKRVGGLSLLEIKVDDVVLDAGCMWGAISIPLARTGCTVIAMDQTEESLKFLDRRRQDEKLENMHIICSDLREQRFSEKVFDKVIVNGVLEWVPVRNDVEVNLIDAVLIDDGEKLSTPYNDQLIFLKKIYASLKEGGEMYLAIENRYDFLYFLGLPEPHCNIKMFSFLPRWLQDFIHARKRGGKFRSWTYSRAELMGLIEQAGFKECDVNYAFPNYRLPDLVLTQKGMNKYRFNSPLGQHSILKKLIVRSVELLVYKWLRLTYFAPAFILVAKK